MSAKCDLIFRTLTLFRILGRTKNRWHILGSNSAMKYNLIVGMYSFPTIISCGAFATSSIPALAIYNPNATWKTKEANWISMRFMYFREDFIPCKAAHIAFEKNRTITPWQCLHLCGCLSRLRLRPVCR